MKHLNNLSSDADFTKEYFPILSSEFPEFLKPYLDTPEMQRLKGSSMSCGTNYTDVFDLKFSYSNYSHSIGVALIVWNFTHDKKATLAGLFHDIATPSFKHCVDFMNGDHQKQESTEEKTREILESSPDILKLLAQDGIKLDEVVDYKNYPIADNDTPKLSADRLEYTLTDGYFYLPIWSIDGIKEIYGNLTVLRNEDGIDELGFSNLEIAEKFVDGASKLWPSWVAGKDKLSMQFIADTLTILNEAGEICVDDLWNLSEQEIVSLIKNGKDKKLASSFCRFEDSTIVVEGEEPKVGVYCKSIRSKQRYIVPLVKTESGAKRVNQLSKKSAIQIDKYLNKKYPKYAYFDFNLETDKQ